MIWAIQARQKLKGTLKFCTCIKFYF